MKVKKKRDLAWRKRRWELAAEELFDKFADGWVSKNTFGLLVVVIVVVDVVVVSIELWDPYEWFLMTSTFSLFLQLWTVEHILLSEIFFQSDGLKWNQLSLTVDTKDAIDA